MAMNFLSDRDVNLLRQMLADWKARRGNPKGRTQDEQNDIQPPEVYIALTPEGGIDGVDGYQPGYATCAVYRLITGVLEVVGTDVLVYNASTTDVPESAWVLAVRDKFGTWWTTGALGAEEEEEEESGTGTGSGTGSGSGSGTGSGDDGDGVDGGVPIASSCGFAMLKQTDCLLAFTDTQEVILVNQGGDWVAEAEVSGTGTGSGSGGVIPTLAYPGGEGEVRFWYESARPHLSVAGMELIDCGNGCWKGGPLTGHAPETSGTGSGSGSGSGEVVTYCDGETFTVCVNCYACPVDEPEPEPDPVVTLCCDGVAIPAVLTLNLGAGTSGCECAGNTAVELTYNAGTEKWEGSATLCGQTVTFLFYCYDNPSWALDYTYPGGGSGLSNVPTSCAPFLWTNTSLSWPPTLCNPGGGGGNTDNITVTE